MPYTQEDVERLAQRETPFIDESGKPITIGTQKAAQILERKEKTRAVANLMKDLDVSIHGLLAHLGYFGCKLWTIEDIMAQVESGNYVTGGMNEREFAELVHKSTGLDDNLSDCTDRDWEYINLAIEQTLASVGIAYENIHKKTEDETFIDTPHG